MPCLAETETGLSSFNCAPPLPLNVTKVHVSKYFFFWVPSAQAYTDELLTDQKLRIVLNENEASKCILQHAV